MKKSRGQKSSDTHPLRTCSLHKALFKMFGKTSVRTVQPGMPRCKNLFFFHSNLTSDAKMPERHDELCSHTHTHTHTHPHTHTHTHPHTHPHTHTHPWMFYITICMNISIYCRLGWSDSHFLAIFENAVDWLYCTIISLYWTATVWFFALLIGFLVKKEMCWMAHYLICTKLARSKNRRLCSTRHEFIRRD